MKIKWFGLFYTNNLINQFLNYFSSIPATKEILVIFLYKLKKSVRINLKLNITLFCISLFFSFSCNENPYIPKEVLPGSRDYVWTADTLWSNDWFGVTDMWGSSPSNIWLTASGTTGWDCLWHYDGVKWERYNEYLNPALNTVFGVVPDEVWIGDGYSAIWKYDGNSWKKFQTLLLSGYDFISIGSIYGTSSNNLYAVGFADHNDASGYKGIILKYDGIRWNFLNIPEIRVGFHKIKRMKNGKYLIWAENSDNGFLEKVFVFDGNNYLKEIYSDYYYPGLYEMNGEVYIVIGQKIYKYKNDELILWKDCTGQNFYGTILGRNEKDYFIAGYDGVYHYNGTDLANLYPTQQLELGGEFIFDKVVFFAGYSSEGRYVMIKGTIKEE